MTPVTCIRCGGPWEEHSVGVDFGDPEIGEPARTVVVARQLGGGRVLICQTIQAAHLDQDL